MAHQAPRQALRTEADIAFRIPDAPSDARPGREQIAAVAAFIAREFRPERIVLYGSRAYGIPSKDSDVDLLVVMDTPLRPTAQAALIRQVIDLQPSFSLDILVRKPEQVRLGLEEHDFFFVDIMTKGATLYEAGDKELGGKG